MQAIPMTSRRRRVGRLLALFMITAIVVMLESGCCSKETVKEVASQPVAAVQPVKEERTLPEDAEISQRLVAEAKVQAIDAQKRLITLRAGDGQTVVVEAGPAVRNLAQIRVGDTVIVSYVESLAVSLKKPGEAIVPASATVAAGRAPLGSIPAGGIGSQVSVTVTIVSIDIAKNLVVFTLPNGELRVTHVKRPEGREFIKGLKPDDRVEITYTEALAISVEPKTPEDAEISQQLVAEAKVQAIDPQKRLIALRSGDGETVVVEAGPAVRNFEQIRVGDTVIVRYVESLAVSLKKPGEAIVPASATVAAARAPLGGTPAGGIGSQVSVTVTIVSVDNAKSLVVFTLPNGESRTTHVKRTEGREFIRGLKPGDRVEITYTEALAISVEAKSP